MLEEGPCASLSLASCSEQLSTPKADTVLQSPLTTQAYVSPPPAGLTTGLSSALPGCKSFPHPSELCVGTECSTVGKYGGRTRVSMCVCVHPPPALQIGQTQGMCFSRKGCRILRGCPLCPDRLSVTSAVLGFIQSTSVLLLLIQEFHFRTVAASSGTWSQASYGLPRAHQPPALPAHALTQP